MGMSIGEGGDLKFSTRDTISGPHPLYVIQVWAMSSLGGIEPSNIVISPGCSTNKCML